jgi:hypothetical protein
MAGETMMATAERSEMAIPKWSGDAGIYVVPMIFILGTLVAVLDLVFRLEFIASSIWLVIVALLIRSVCNNRGGYRKFLVIVLGFAGRQFMESVPQGVDSVEIRFGFTVFGHRFFYLKVPLNKIEMVRWQYGMHTAIARRDTNDWDVSIWLDYDDSEKNRKDQSLSQTLARCVYTVSPPRSKRKTVAFGLAFVEFLRKAGAMLVQGEDDCTFVRAELQTKEDGES